MKKQIIISVMLAAGIVSVCAQNSTGINIRADPFSTPIPFNSAAIHSIETGTLRLPVELVPANPTPLTSLQPRVFLIPTPLPAIAPARPAVIMPYVSPFPVVTLKK